MKSCICPSKFHCPHLTFKDVHWGMSENRVNGEEYVKWKSTANCIALNHIKQIY